MIVLVCFFLPWIQVSCGSATDSVAGIDLARQGHGILWLIPLLMIAAALGVFVRSWHDKLDFGALLGFIAGLMSTYLMYRERLRTEDASGLVQARLTGWFWLGLFSSIALLIVNAIQFLKKPKPL
jgi:uncharacterized membrane protein YfcA